MLALKTIRTEAERIKARLAVRNWSREEIAIVDRILELDERRKSEQTDSDNMLARRNELTRQIGDLFKLGKGEQAVALKQQVAELKLEIEQRQRSSQEVRSELDSLLVQLPNTANDLVPAGKTDEDNELVTSWSGPLPALGEDALPHWELAEKYNLIDFKRGATITGSGFVVYRGKGARLERALINFFLDQAHEAGYEEFIPPLVVNRESAFATGQLPDKEGMMYHVEKDELYLIPTAEVPLTNLYRDTIVDAGDLPIRLTGYTPCFRREAGSYGAHVKGLNRLHQFDKVEIVQVQHPHKSYDALDEMVGHVAEILVKLELPYRVVRLCGGDLGFAAAMTYDFEVYSGAQHRWLEVSSVSNFETFQSNRLKLRFREDGKNVLAHTLNGSALALPRILAALLENNQDSSGISIPGTLRPYTGFDRI